MGDPGQLEIGPIEAKAKVKELEVDLSTVKEEVLKFEQPQKIKFRLHNVTEK